MPAADIPELAVSGMPVYAPRGVDVGSVLSGSVPLQAAPGGLQDMSVLAESLPVMSVT